jgi:hypothetical protein
MTRLSLCLCGLLLTAPVEAEITADQRAQLESVQKLVKQAGSLYVQEKYDESAQSIATALATAKKLIATKDPDVLKALEGDYGRMKKAYELLRAKGITLPAAAKKQENQRSQPASKSGSSANVSFTKEVVPILISKCGKCHIEETKGRFSNKDFVSLMEGSRKGKAVVPNDTEKSRLLTLIKSRKMPPKSKGFPPEQFEILKAWIEQGAKFDGHDQKGDLRTLKLATDE